VARFLSSSPCLSRSVLPGSSIISSHNDTGFKHCLHPPFPASTSPPLDQIELTIQHLELHSSPSDNAQLQLAFALSRGDKRHAHQTEILCRTSFGIVSRTKRQGEGQGGEGGSSNGKGAVVVRWGGDLKVCMHPSSLRQRLAISCFDYSADEDGEVSGANGRQAGAGRERRSRGRVRPSPVGSACVNVGRLLQSQVEVGLETAHGMVVGTLVLNARSARGHQQHVK